MERHPIPRHIGIPLGSLQNNSRGSRKAICLQGFDLRPRPRRNTTPHLAYWLFYFLPLVGMGLGIHIELMACCQITKSCGEATQSCFITYGADCMEYTNMAETREAWIRIAVSIYIAEPHA